MATTVPAPLAGKVAIITGGTRGIGASIAEAFARKGCTHIAITYYSAPELAAKTLDKIASIQPGIKTCSIHADLADEDFGHKVVQGALAGLGVDRIDIAVSNAATTDIKQFKPIKDTTKEDWDRIMTIMAWGPVSLARAAAEHMPKGGRVVLLSSGAAKLAMGDPMVAYAAGKAALEAASKNLAALWGPTKGITVNSIGVGTTRTEAVERSFKEWGPGFEKMATDFSLLKRVGEPSEIAEIVSFVASPQASWIVGNQIPANGGGLAMLQS